MNKQDICDTVLNKKIPLSEPWISGNEWQYIKRCLDTNWVSSAGAYVESFENYMADYLGKKQAVACVNGTSALHIALLIAGIQPQDEVIVPALTFIAPASAVRYCGAWPVFMDVMPDTWQMDPVKVKDFLMNECKLNGGNLVNKNTGRKVKAVLPVHILGYPCDMDPIVEAAAEFGLKIIGDATESLGALYKGTKVGALSDISVLSFNGNKIITAGGGGMIITDNCKWADKARYLINQAKDDPLEYVHNEVGYNYRLTNIQAAMGLAQAEKLDEYINAKRRIAARYNEKLGSVKGRNFIHQAEWAAPNFWLYTVNINSTEYGMGSRALLNRLRRENIESRPLWHPLHSLKPFLESYSYKVEVADQLYRDCLSLPCSAGLSDKEQDRVIDIIKDNAKRI